MSLVSSDIPNFLGGVSQQPYTLRLPNQGELQENLLPSVALGLRRRPGTRHIAKLFTTPRTDSFLHVINRDGEEKYVVEISEGLPRVFDINGNAKSISAPGGYEYLTTDHPSRDIRAVTVADYTFILNRAVEVATDPTTLATPLRPHEAIIVVKQGNFGKSYSIHIAGDVAATFNTPTGSTTSDITQISTDYIAAQLAGQLATYAHLTPKAVTNITYVTGTGFFGSHLWSTVSFDLPAGSTTSNTAVYVAGASTSFTSLGGTRFQVTGPGVVGMPITASDLTSSSGTIVARTGSVIYFASTSDFSIECVDGFNNFAMAAYKGKVQEFSNLPPTCPVEATTLQITGASTALANSYYAAYTTDSGSNATGVWQETCKPGLVAGLDATSMVHVLVREADGTFTFKAADWTGRVVGDDDTNPHPSFVGRKINEVFFHRNRLGFLSDENVVFSESGKFFNLYRTTVIQLLDSERIDVSVANTQVSVLEWALPFNKQLLLFSKQTQFLLEQQDLLSPNTINIKPTTQFPCNTAAKPLGVGQNVYFSADRGNWSVIREYYADLNNYANDAVDVTGHVPSYIPSGIFKITASSNDNILCALSANDPSSIYVYNFYWSNNQKEQSAWHKWTMNAGCTVVNAEFIDSVLYLIVNRGDGCYLEAINMSPEFSSGFEPFITTLDRKVDIDHTSVTMASGNTYLHLPIVPQDGEEYVAVTGTGSTEAVGQRLPVLVDSGGAYVIGDHHNANFTVGVKYTSRYRLSPIVIRTPSQSGGSKADTVGRLQVRRIVLNFAGRGDFHAEVTAKARDTNTYTQAASVLVGGESHLDSVLTYSGKIPVTVMTQNIYAQIDLVSDSAAPCSFLSASWEGFYVKRSSPV